VASSSYGTVTNVIYWGRGESRNTCRISVEKPDGLKHLGRPRHKRNYITIDIREAGFEGVDWTSGGPL
jgi:hypothetical protein